MSDPMMLTGVPLALFMIVGAIALASSILVVSMRNPVHSALFLLLTFLCVAVLFITMGAEFVGAVQVLVYAGGGMVLFLILAIILGSGKWAPTIDAPDNLRTTTSVVTTPVVDAGGATVQTETSVSELVGNSEAVGMALYRDYLVPFELASLFLLVAMIGAIVIGKRDLHASEEERIPEFIAKKVSDEARVKGVTGA